MTAMKNLSQKILVLVLLFAFVLSACQPGNGQETQAPTPFSTLTPGPASTPTPLPQRVLNICLGGTPNTLYPLGVPNGRRAQRPLRHL